MRRTSATKEDEEVEVEEQECAGAAGVEWTAYFFERLEGWCCGSGEAKSPSTSVCL